MRSRSVLRVALGLGVFLLLVGVYYGWMLWQVSRDLSDAAQAASRAQQAMVSGDDTAVAAAVDDLSEHSHAAADLSGGPTWSVLTKVPAVGDDAAAVRLVSDVVADLSSSDLTTLLQADLDGLVPRDGGIDLAAVTALRTPVEAGHQSLVEARDRLAGQDPSSFVGPLRTRFQDVQEQLDSATDALGAVDTATRLLPTMLGDGETRTYLVVLQNNAELRSTGGLAGSVLEVQARDGRLELKRQVAGNSFGEASAPVLPLSKAETDIYTEVMGTYFLNAGMTPDFPRAAQLWRARWEQKYGGEVDGVLTMDPVALSYLLEATGPLTVAGHQLTADNAVDQLLHQVYLDNPEPAAQDKVFEQVAAGLFERLTSGAAQPRPLLRALHQAVSEQRIMLSSFHEDDQRLLHGTRIAGELATTAPQGAGPEVGVYLNDATGAKMSYYLRSEARVNATYCTDGVQGLKGQLTLASHAPTDAATTLPAYVTGAGEYGVEPGTQWVATRLYGPVGGKLDQVLINGAPAEGTTTVVHDGRPVVTLLLNLEPQKQVEVEWRMVSGPGQTGDPELRVTPGVESGTPSAGVSACHDVQGDE